MITITTLIVIFIIILKTLECTYNNNRANFIGLAIGLVILMMAVINIKINILELNLALLTIAAITMCSFISNYSSNLGQRNAEGYSCNSAKSLIVIATIVAGLFTLFSFMYLPHFCSVLAVLITTILGTLSYYSTSLSIQESGSK
jgi:hypothetical protein